MVRDYEKETRLPGFADKVRYGGMVNAFSSLRAVTR